MAKIDIKELSVAEFMAQYRPDGKGKMGLYTGNSFEEIEFDEIVCDICNAEIPKSNEQELQESIYIIGTYLYCKECMEKHNKRYAKR